MLKQAKDTTLDETEDDFSDLGVLDDSNSMYMVSAVQKSCSRVARQCKSSCHTVQALTNCC